MHTKILKELVSGIKKEIKIVCSCSSKSVLTETKKNLTTFSWSKLGGDLESNLPMLTALLKGLVPKGKMPFISMITCMLLRQINSKITLGQKIISIFLYGNAASKQVRMIQA